MKKYFSTLVAVIGFSFLFSGCGGANLTPDVEEAFNSNATMYTQSNMHYNISRRSKIVDTVNYGVGILIPVNSEVTLEDINAKQIIFTYQGSKIILRNNIKYTGLDISAISQRYFAPTKVDLSKFSSAEKKAIRSALVKNGMSKSAVLISLGVPPAHETPTLEMDQWKYWKSRWSTFFVNFENDKVVNYSSNHKNDNSNESHGLSLRIN